MNWQEFTDLQIAYKQELVSMNYEKTLELNHQVYEVMFQIYSKIPQEKHEHKQHLKFRLGVLKAEAITLEEILSREAEQNNKEEEREMLRQIMGEFDLCIQKIINDKINKDGIYYDYIQAVIDDDYIEALKLNRKLCQRVSKIFSESEEPIKKQVILRLGLLEKTAKDIQTKIDRL